ncbi:MAG: TonB-dependent receptor domain-containing protein, partial [Candidatus Latescibacterota bacterium]
MYKDFFFQAFQNWTDAGDTFLLRSGDPIRDKSTLTVLQLQHSYEIGARQRFTYGADVLRTRPDTEGTINGANEDDDDINEFGVYLQSETSLTDQLELVLAARYDDHNRIPDAELSPRAAIVFKPTDTQTLRLTYNSAFSTPSNNNMYLDLVSSRDAFSTGALFQPTFGFAPSFDIRAQGTYRRGFDGGFSFMRSANGRPQFRSPFAPLAGASPEQYWDLNDPLFTNVMWSVGRGATLAQLTPVFAGLVAGQLQAAGLDAATAQAQAGALAAALPSLIPEQLGGLNNSLMSLNLEKVAAGDAAPFDPVADAYDVPFTRSTNTHTFELGYKGVLGNKLVVAADAYRTTTENFVGPLAVETPNVFLEPTSLAAALGPGIAAAMADPANAQVAGAVAALDAVQVPGVVEGNGNGTAVDEVTALFVGGAASIPYGTVSPEQAYDPTALILAYRNFGKVTTSGFDLNLAYYASDALMLSGGMAYIQNNFFEDVDGIADIALNAPKLKLKMGAQYALEDMGLRLGAQVRYSDSFRQSSGVYIGD